MSDFDDTNAEPAIEPCIIFAYSAVSSTDLRTQPQADLHLPFLPNDMVCANCASKEGLVIQESTMIKEAESSRWKLTQNIQVSSSEIPLFSMLILSRYPGNDDHCHFLGNVEVETASWISEFATREHRGCQLFTQLDDDDSVLDLGIEVVVVPSRPSSNLSSADGNRSLHLPTTNGQSGPDLTFNILIDFPTLWGCHGMRFLRRFEQFGGEDDLQNAISELDNSVSFTADSDPIKPHRLCLLCQALKHRFLLLSNRGDIDRAIKLGHDAVTLAEGDRDNFQSCLLILLSDFYSCRYEILENLDDLNSAVSAAELAVSASAEGHPRKAHALVVLIGCLNRRFEQLPGLNDIESVIEKGRLAFSLVEEDELKSQVLENIAHPLAHRFMHLGKSDDLEESISAMKKAIDLMPKSSPYSSDKVGFLSFLLAKRFVLFDNPADLEEAIIKGTDAMNVMSSTDPNWPRILDTLSGCFYERFQLNGDLNDLTESISLLQSSLSESSIPDESFSKPVLLHRLGGHLRCRFLETKDANDIDEAVSAGRHAVECTPDGDTEKPSQLHYLIASLQTRFRYRKNIDDLEESITCGGKALSLVPSDDPNHPSLYHTILAQLRISRGLRSDRFKNISDTEEATSLCNSFDLSPIALPSARLNATLHQAEAHIDADCPNALKAYEAALNLLPRVAWTGKSIAARHRKLVRYGSIVNGAAAYTIQLGYANTALKWLETGPAIVWGQLHNLHSRVDDLSDAHPHFAERLSQLAFALEKATSQDVDSEDFKGLTIEEIARKHHHLASEWDSLVETVRVLPGFEDFLGPKRFSMFKKAAKLGPVILINISPTRCDALILTPDLEDAGIHIPLKDFTYDNAKNLQEQLTKALSALGVRTRASQPVHATSEKNVFMKVLKVLWTCIVKPVLDGLDFSPCDSTNLPRLWWCPTGPLAFLPIHAAGDYHTNERGTKLSDYVISSYTPTLTILLDKLEKT